MPIPPNRMDSILAVDPETAVRQVVGTLVGGDPYDQWYTVVVLRASGNFDAFTLAELNDVAETMGAAVLNVKVGELFKDRPLVQTVEQAKTNPNKAERDARRAPGKRLLVLDEGKPVGVVAIKSRGVQKVAVVDLYRDAAGPDPEAEVNILDDLVTRFLSFRPQVTLNEAYWALGCADVEYVVVPLSDGQYALLEQHDIKSELEKLGHYTLDQIYAFRTRTGKRVLSKPLRGVDISHARSTQAADAIVLREGKALGFFPRPERGAKAAQAAADGGGVRYVNAWFKDHKPSQPLARGTRYDLGINVGEQRADSYVSGKTYEGPVGRDIYVGLVGDPAVWEIHGSAVKKLYIPADGDAESLFFQVTPLKPGQQQLLAHFYDGNHLIQTVEITGVQVAIPDAGGAVAGRGQSPVAVILTRAAGNPISTRDANLYIEWLPDQDRFRFTFFSAGRNGGQGNDLIFHSARVSTTPEEMRTMSEAARDTVETHMVACKEGNIWPFHILSEGKGQQPSDEAYANAIHRVAQLGYRWFINLFYASRDPDFAKEAETLGDLLLQASAGGPLYLQVVSSDFYLPWNLLYTDPSGGRKPLTKKTENVEEGIWGFRHVIEQVPARDLAHTRQGPIIDAADGLKMSANINKNIDREFYKPAADQIKFLEDKASDPALKLDLTMRFNEDDVLEAFQDEDNVEEIFYFYCHAVTEGDAKTRFEHSRLVITDEAHALLLGDLITGTFGLSPLPKAPLVFLNACGSGQMDARFYDSFVQYMRDRGARTVIGTLNNTPIAAGAEFAKKFLEQFLQGGPENSAAKLLFKLRRELLDVYRNPIGLSYALFYNGDTYVKRET